MLGLIAARAFGLVSLRESDALRTVFAPPCPSGDDVTMSD